jgi:hypothetical protein
MGNGGTPGTDPRTSSDGAEDPFDPVEPEDPYLLTTTRGSLAPV